MPYAYQQYTGNGSTATFTVPFPYLLRSHVRLYYGLNLVTGGYQTLLVDGTNYNWTNGNTVQLTVAPPNGTLLTIRRETPTTSRLVDWSDGSSLSAADMDTADLQNFYAIQEHRDFIEGLTITPTANVADNSITANKLSTDAVTTSKIADNTITSQKIVNGAISDASISPGAGIAASKMNFTQSGAGAVTRTIDGKLKEFISVKDFGAVGDGVTDDYNAIKNAFAALQAADGGTLVFPKGTYFINQYRIDGGPSANGIVNFVLQNLNNVCISGYGAKLVMKGGWTRTADYSAAGFTYSYRNNIGFSFSNCTNLAIEGLEVDGGASTIVKQATAEGYSYGIVLEGCTQVSLRDLYVHHYCTDGLLVSSSGPITAFKVSRQVHATNCRFNNNGRQGMSIIQLRHATFTNCDFSFTGTTGTYGGHSPQSGVDIEPNYVHDNPTAPLYIAGDDSTGDISFIGCRFKDNIGFEFVGSSRDSVQHPVQFVGCLFQNTNNSSPQVVSATKITRFYACNFDDVDIYPGYTFNDDNTTELHGCRIISKRASAYAILHAQANPTLIVDRCDIQFRATASSAGTYRIYIQSPKCEFTNNRIFVSYLEHGSSTYQVHSLLQQVRKSEGNRFSTDLVTSSKLFTFSYSGAVKVDDYFEQPTYISPSTSAWPRNEHVAGAVFTAGQITDTASGKSIYHGSAAPVSGTYVLGDRVINTAPTVGGIAEWICTAAGTPGTWTPLLLPNSSVSRTVDFGYKNGSVTSVVFEFVSDNSSGSCIAEITVAGFQAATRVVVAKYATQAAIVMQNSGGHTITTSGSASGGLKVEIAISLTHPCVTATATVGGLATGFSTAPTISFV